MHTPNLDFVSPTLRTRLTASRARLLGPALAISALLACGSAPAANIAWVSFHPSNDVPSGAAMTAGFTRAPDVGYTDLLTASGHTVTRFLTLDNAAVNASHLNTNDLVILSRSVPSGHYEVDAETAFWNGTVTAPTMVLGGYIIRQNRLGYFVGSTIPDVSSAQVQLNVNVPVHPIFTGIPLDEFNNMVNAYASRTTFNGLDQRGISVVTGETAVGGQVLATIGTSGDAAFGGTIVGEWQTGATMSTVPPDTLGGPRLVFLTGSRERDGLTAEGAGIYDLNPDGSQMFLNAVNYMVDAPIVAPVTPRNGTLFHHPTNNFVFRVVAGEPGGIPATAVSMTLNGETVTLSSTGTDADRTYTFSGLETNQFYTAVLTAQGAEAQTIATVEFDTVSESGVVIFEAEDYNYAAGITCFGDATGSTDQPAVTGGSFIDNPPPSMPFITTEGYALQVGAPNVDYSDTTVRATSPNPAVDHVYRICDATGTQPAADVRRQKYTTASEVLGDPNLIPDYQVHMVQPNEWMNYTRTYPQGAYRVYLRASAGAAQSVGLDEVTSDRSQPGQTTSALGTFNIPASGSAFGYTPLTDSQGEPVVVVLSDVRTLRLTALGANNNLRLNYVMVVPALDVTVLPPFLSQTTPADDAQGVWPTTTVSATIRNGNSSVNPASIRLYFDNVEVTGSSTITPGAEGAVVTYQPTQYQPGDTHTVRVEFADDSIPPLEASAEWSFTMANFPAGDAEVVGTGSIGGQWVGVCFSGVLDAVTAGNVANYRVNGAAPSSAQVRADDQSVRLLLASPVAGSFNLTVSNVLDWKGTAVTGVAISGQVIQLTGVMLQRLEGDPAAEGSEWTCSADWVELTADGSDLWNEADAGRFLYQTVTGNFDKRVRVEGFNPVTDVWAKAALDARIDPTGAANHILVAATPQPPGNNHIAAQERINYNGPSTSWDGGVYTNLTTFPKWLRLRREGNLFSAYAAADGNNWTLISVKERADLPAALEVGLALSSHSIGNPTTVRFSMLSDVQFAGVSVTITQHPASQTISAQSRATFTAGAEVVNASASELVFTWQRSLDNGATWENVQIGDSTTYMTERIPDEVTRQYRVIASAAGVQDTSDVATLTITPFVQTGANIAWVGFHAGDDQPTDAAAGAGFTRASDAGYTDLLWDNGHAVTRYVTTATPDVDYLHQFDLVIISRAVASGGYQTDASRALWHSLTNPMMLMGGYIVRGGTGGGTRLGFMAGETIPDVNSNPVRLTVNEPAHPIFTGVSLDAQNLMVNPYAVRITHNGLLQAGISTVTGALAGGGTSLATVGTAGDAALGGTIIGEWQAGAVMATATADVLAGHRLTFLSGSREAGGVPVDGAGIYDLQTDGARLFLNAVNYMVGIEPTPVLTILRPIRAGNTFSAQVQSRVGFTYELQYRNLLTDSGWTTADTVAGTGEVITLTDAQATNPTRFYQMVEIPQ